MTADSRIPHQVGGVDRALQREASVRRRVEILEAELSPQVTVDSTEWIFRLTEIADRNDLERDVVVGVASDLAWRAREVGQRIPGDSEWSRCNDPAESRTTRRILAYVHGFRLRFDFRFEELSEWSRDWLLDFPDDVLILAFAAFAALGMHSERGQPLVDRVLQAPDLDAVARATCLHGLWFGSHMKDQAERIMKLSDEMIARGEDNSNLYYWRAFAQRRSGRLNDALDSINTAIRLLPVGMNAVHQDYFREREFIATTRLLDEHVENLSTQLRDSVRDEFLDYLETAKQELADQTRVAQEVVSRSLLSLVEVLALFVTLAGFLLGSGAVVVQASGFVESFASIALLLVGSVAFFVLLRGVIRIDRIERPIVLRIAEWFGRRVSRGRGRGA
ncbi:MAG: hypothetical protein GEV03_18715 [Streptosporangiales bacterium]|nr:hypothetical protein [Streptosporangiales bacterium]